MSQVVIIGAGTGGVPAAYELRAALGKKHEVTLINSSPRFQFVPSNPWIAVGWREPADTTVDLAPILAKHGITFVAEPVARIDAEANALELASGARLAYDYLVITTGPKLAFDEITGFGIA
jgi:sulfide:quinone oxidoreductase